MEFVYGEFRTYQIPIRVIEGKTGLTFGDLPKFDPFNLVEAVGGARPVDGADDLVL